MIREEIVNFGEGGGLNGIFSSAIASGTDSFCLIFLNAGLIHKIGPNRIYRKLSEKFSKIGFNTFRFDFSGIGDSQSSNDKISGDASHVREIVMAMNCIQKSKGIDKFLLSGICSGARLAFLAALQDSRVIGLSLIDGEYEDAELMKQVVPKAHRKTALRYYKKNIFSLQRWMKLLSGKSKILTVKNVAILLRSIWVAMASKAKKESAFDGDRHQPLVASQPTSAGQWEKLVERGVKVQLIFCEGGSAIDIYNLTIAQQLSKYQKTREIETTLVNDVDHTFTPLWSQDYLSDLISSWLMKEFNERLSGQRRMPSETKSAKD